MLSFFDNVAKSMNMACNCRWLCCHTTFDGIHVRNTCTFDSCLQAGKQEKVRRSQIMGVRRVIKDSYHNLRQEWAHTNRTVCCGIIVEQHPFSSPVQLWAEPVGYAVAIGSKLPVKCGINGLTCWIKFLMDDIFVVEEGEQQCFDLWFFADDPLLSRGSRWTPRRRLPFWFRIELVAPSLVSRDDVFLKQWIPATHGNEVSRSFHPFCFLFVCELVRHKSGSDLQLIQIISDDGMRRAPANAQFLRNQS